MNNNNNEEINVNEEVERNIWDVYDDYFREFEEGEVDIDLLLDRINILEDLLWMYHVREPHHIYQGITTIKEELLDFNFPNDLKILIRKRFKKYKNPNNVSGEGSAVDTNNNVAGYPLPNFSSNIEKGPAAQGGRKKRKSKKSRKQKRKAKKTRKSRK